MFSSANAFIGIRQHVGGESQTAFDIEDQHYFTPQEASKLLPDIRPKIKQLVEHKKVLKRLHDEMERYNLLGFRTDEIAEKAAELDAMVDEMTKKIAELEDLGVIVTDLDYGMVDFPADRYGEKVMLCWRYGEPEVSYWHRPNESSNVRKPLNVQMVQP
jgi:hypothetical protein